MDASHLLPVDSRDYLELTMREQKVRLYIIPGLPEDTPMETQTRREISVRRKANAAHRVVPSFGASHREKGGQAQRRTRRQVFPHLAVRHAPPPVDPGEQADAPAQAPAPAQGCAPAQGARAGRECKPRRALWCAAAAASSRPDFAAAECAEADPRLAADAEPRAVDGKKPGIVAGLEQAPAQPPARLQARAGASVGCRPEPRRLLRRASELVWAWLAQCDDDAAAAGGAKQRLAAGAPGAAVCDSRHAQGAAAAAAAAAGPATATTAFAASAAACPRAVGYAAPTCVAA